MSGRAARARRRRAHERSRRAAVWRRLARRRQARSAPARARSPRRSRCANGSASTAASRRACSASTAAGLGRRRAARARPGDGLQRLGRDARQPEVRALHADLLPVAPRRCSWRSPSSPRCVAVQVPIAIWEKRLALDLRRRAAAAGRRARPVHRQGRQRRAPLDPAGHHELPAVRAGQAGDRDVRRRLHGAQAWT